MSPLVMPSSGHHTLLTFEIVTPPIVAPSLTRAVPTCTPPASCRHRAPRNAGCRGLPIYPGLGRPRLARNAGSSIRNDLGENRQRPIDHRVGGGGRGSEVASQVDRRRGK